MIAEFENGRWAPLSLRDLRQAVKITIRLKFMAAGALTFNFERMNELQYLNLDDPADEQGYKTILVTNMTHPYAGAWWAAPPCNRL